MKIGIVGAGALGGLFSGLLTESGEEVWLLDKYKRHAGLINKKGLLIEKEGRRRRVKVKATTSACKIGACDLVIILVKAYDTEKAAYDALPLVGKNTSVLTLQNGLGNLEILNKVVGKRKVIGGTTAQGANVVGDAKITHAGWGKTIIGEQGKGITNRIKKIRAVFNKAGIKTFLSAEIKNELWKKLVINACINPLTAIIGFSNGELLKHKLSLEFMHNVVREIVKVAKAKKIKLTYRTSLERVKRVCKETASNVSSMLQDIRKGKKTEIDYINGGIVKEARRLGIPTPTNELMWNLVKSISKN